MRINRACILVIFLLFSKIEIYSQVISLQQCAIQDTFYTHMPIYVKLGVYNQNDILDSSYIQAPSITVLFGNTVYFSLNTSIPTFKNGIMEYDEMYFTSPGTYQLKFDAPGLSAAYTDTFTIINGMSFSNNTANTLFVPNYTDSISVNETFFFYALALNTTASTVDTNYNDSVYIQQFSGIGSLIGSTALTFEKGIAIFSSLEFDHADNYKLLLQSNTLQSDTLTITVIDTSIMPGNNLCQLPTKGERKNIGIYGGLAQDLAYSYKTNRVFTCIESPVSLLYSDDTTHTWEMAFSYDSLSYECGERGWGGGGTRVLTNRKGWVMACTQEQGGNLSSSIISYANGDSASWQTAVDIYLLQQAGLTKSTNVVAIELTDYKSYTATESYITLLDSASKDIATSTIDIKSKISGIPTNSRIIWIGASNNINGYPFYVAIDTSYTSVNDLGNEALLYKYDGTTFSLLNLPSGFTGITNLYVHHAANSGDTLFVSWHDKLNNLLTVIRSFDGGNTWTDISPSGTSDFKFKVSYSEDWITNHPLSNGTLLQCSGSAYSFDLGNTWTYFTIKDLAHFIVKPDNELISIGAKELRLEISKTGITGPYAHHENVGFEAVKVFDIDRDVTKSVFYVATNIGLAYTTAYLNDTIENYEKWKLPFGNFPITDINGDTISTTTVAIDPLDSSHIVTGYNGFFVSTTGSTGFQKVFNFSSDTTAKGTIADIAFVNSNVVLAVTRDPNSIIPVGDIWRSNDGGFTWNKILLSGFNQGRVIACGYAKNDTIIYIGTGNTLANDGDLWRSNDLGVNWSLVNNGLVFNSIDKISTAEQPIIDIAIDTRSNDTLYIVSDLAVAKSMDGGKTYNYLDYMGSEGVYSAIAIDNDEPDSIYVAVGNEVFLYDAIKDSATLIIRSYPGETTYDLEIGSILVGTITGFYGVGYDILDDIVVGINNKKILENNILVYPNPSQNYFTVIYNSNSRKKKAKVDLYTLLGELIFTQTYSGNEDGNNPIKIDCPHLKNGSYLLCLHTDNQLFYSKISIAR